MPTTATTNARIDWKTLQDIVPEMETDFWNRIAAPLRFTPPIPSGS
jgi:hypothetical protein